ncbi:hypothetical protein SASPL_153545 [Salvia splendens]|uniref:Disease resistance N-terminal domain-containing protein n=1 Tax=Salvia splendens TaxID=180675 RepID=A0A8X8VYI9_SALSN|nr:hypothetical protein SASPL_153545 [Salvia splendens]
MKQQLLFALKFLTLSGAYMFTRSRTPAHKLRSPEKSLAVLFILENLKRIFVDNRRLINDSKIDAEILENDVRLFKAFLKDCANRRTRNAAIEGLAAEIEAAVAEAEDAIAAYAAEAAVVRDRNFIQRALGGQRKLVAAARKVRAMKVKVRNIYQKSRDNFFR